MKWSIQELRKKNEAVVHIDETMDVKTSLLARDDEIIDVSPIHVQGNLVIEDSDFFLNANVTCEVTLPSSRSLTPVTVPLDFDFQEIYMTPEQDCNRPESLQDEIVFVLEKDLIDITEAVEDNLLLNLPIQVLSPEEEAGEDLPMGQGWEVILESDYEEQKKRTQEETVDPRLAKLSTLFAETEEEE